MNHLQTFSWAVTHFVTGGKKTEHEKLSKISLQRWPQINQTNHVCSPTSWWSSLKNKWKYHKKVKKTWKVTATQNNSALTRQPHILITHIRQLLAVASVWVYARAYVRGLFVTSLHLFPCYECIRACVCVHGKRGVWCQRNRDITFVIRARVRSWLLLLPPHQVKARKYFKVAATPVVAHVMLAGL